MSDPEQINEIDDDGNTPLLRACRAGDLIQVLKYWQGTLILLTLCIFTSMELY